MSSASERLSLPRPRSRTDSPFASRFCPDLIMHPHPVSDVKPCGSMSWLLSRTPSVMLEFVSWLSDLGIGTKFDRYVIQGRDSKSDMKDSGHPRSVERSCAGASSGLLTPSTDVDVGCSGWWSVYIRIDSYS